MAPFISATRELVPPLNHTGETGVSRDVMWQYIL